MSSTSPDTSEREQRLEQVLAEYLRSIEAGQPLDRAQLLAQHPDLAADLQSFFRNRSAVEKLAAPLVEAAETPTLGLTAGESTSDGLKIRYFGDYELLEEIARGGMGVVYKARQKSLSRLVALKMILRGQLASEADVERFQREAEAAANLDHPNIVPIYEVGQHEGQHYFSMKLIEGGSLRDRLQEFRSDHRDAARLMAQAVRAVHHAHQRGVLHRDLKPANILIDAAGQPHVTDFGLAKRVEGPSDLTQSGAIVGTPSYMAPEQASAKQQLTTAADVYSLGAILYELLTGRPPFRGESAADTLVQLLSQEPPTPRSLNRGIDRDLDTITRKCLEKDPQRRYDSAAALAEDLERWLRGEPVLARRSTRWEQAAKWARRKPAAAALVAVSALAIVALIVAQAINNRAIRGQMQLADQSAAAASQAMHDAMDARGLAVRRLYGAQVLLANATLEQTQIGQAKRALDSTPQELRGWEWDYLHAVSDTSRRTIHVDDSVSGISFSPDGTALGLLGDIWGALWFDLSASEKIRMQNADSGYGHTVASPVSNAVFSQDLRLALIYTRAGLDLWDTQADKRILLGPRRTQVNKDGVNAVMGAVAFSADGKLGYCAADKRVACWDLAAQKEVWQIPMEGSDCWAIAISPDGKQVAVGWQDGTARIFDIASKTEIFRSPAHVNTPDWLAFTLDGKRLVSQSRFQNPRLWDIASKQQLLKLSLSSTSYCSAISPDRRVVASGMESGEVVLWSTDTGKELHVLRGTIAFINCTAFSPDSRLVAFGGRDKVVQLWNVKDGTLVRKLIGHTDAIGALAFSLDGKTLASAASNEIKLWDVGATSNPLKLPLRDGEVRAWQFFPDGRRLAAAGWWLSGGREHPGLADIWDLETGKILRTFGPHGTWIEALSLSRDGRLLATADTERTVKLWQTDDGKLVRTFGRAITKEETQKLFYPWGLRSVVIRDDGKQIAAGDSQGNVTVYNVADGSIAWTAYHALPAVWNYPLGPVKALPPMEIRALQYTDDGKQLLGLTAFGSAGRQVLIWNADSGQPTFASEQLQYVAPWAVSGDGRMLAYGAGMFNKKVWLRDLVAGKELRVFDGHDDISSLAVSHDGKWLAIAASQYKATLADGRVHVASAAAGNNLIDLYNAATGQRQATMSGHESTVGTLAFLPDGSRLISGGWDHSVKIWDSVSGQELLSLPMGPNPDERVEHILVSPDGSRIAATNGFPDAGGGPRETVVVWKASAHPAAMGTSASH